MLLLEFKTVVGEFYVRPIGGTDDDWHHIGANPWLGGPSEALIPIAPRDERNPDGTMKHPELAVPLPETSGPVVQDGPGPAVDSGGRRGFG